MLHIGRQTADFLIPQRALQTQKNNIDDPIERLAKDLNRLFTSKENEVLVNHLKRYSTSVIIKEMQIKIIRYNT